MEQLLKEQDLDTGFTDDFIEESEFDHNVYIQESTITADTMPDITVQEPTLPQPITQVNPVPGNSLSF